MNIVGDDAASEALGRGSGEADLAGAPQAPTVMVRSSRPILPFRVKSLSLVLARRLV